MMKVHPYNSSNSSISNSAINTKPPNDNSTNSLKNQFVKNVNTINHTNKKQFKRPLNGKSRNQVDLSQYVFGKVQPQAVELEEAVLGALMLDKDAFFQVMNTLSPNVFYKEAHHKIYSAMLRLFKKSAPIDLLTVTEEVKLSGDLEMVGGPYMLVELTNRVASAANIEYHSRILVQKYMQRNLIKISTETIRAAYEDTTDVFDLYDNLEIKLMNTKEQIRKGSNKSNVNISIELMKDIEKAKSRANGILGIPIFGIQELDEMLNGAEEDDFILIAGRPGMGKSSLANSIIINAIENDIPMVMWSIEMTSKKTFARTVSGLSGVPYKTIIRGQANHYEAEAIQRAIDKINNSRIIFREDPVNIHEFRSEVISMKQKHDIEAVIFDRIGLFSKSDLKHNDFTHISEVSPILRRTANELKMPMIIISQLSRAVETRGGMKRPMLSDLRNSGSLEQDATKVIFCYRPEYYKIMEDNEGRSTKGKGELIIAKNSNGQSQTVHVEFKSECMVYKEIKKGSTEDDDFWNNTVNNTTNNQVMLTERMSDDDIPF